MATGQFVKFVSTAWALGDGPAGAAAIFWHLTKNLRVRLGVGRYHPEQVYQLATRYGTVHLRDNFGDVTNLHDLFFRNVYRVGALSEEGAVLDVGANIGLFSLWAAHHNPGRPIFSFEPIAGNCAMVRKNCPAAVVTNAGAGREPSVMSLRVDQHSVMASNSEMPWPTETQEFPVLPLDDFARQHNITSVAFLKIDTEGMELDVLDGAREVLRRTARAAMETHSEEKHRGSIERLQTAGLRIIDQRFGPRTGMIYAQR